MKKQTVKEIVSILVLALALTVFAGAASTLTTPKRMDYGSTWGRFLQEEENSIDVLFFGSSITYCDVVPASIWETSGITSYVMAGPEQTIPISYYYIREASKTQLPKAIFLEVTGVFFNRYQDFTKANIGYMPQGSNRLGATFFAAEKEERTGLLFPLHNYHSRWDSLESADFKVALQGYPADELAGYTFLSEAVAIDGIQPRNEVWDEENYRRNLDYLAKIAEFCQENDILPVFYIAPTCQPVSEEHLQMLEKDLSALANVRYFDFNLREGVPEFDSQIDWFDPLHFNFRGAEKFSRYIGGFMKDELGLSPTADADTALWTQRCKHFQSLK